MFEFTIRPFAALSDIPSVQAPIFPNVFPQRYAFTPAYQSMSAPELAVMARIVQQTSVYSSWKAFRAGDLVPSADGSQRLSDWFETLGVLVTLLEYGVVTLWRKRGTNLQHGLYVAPTLAFVEWVEQARLANALIVTK